MSYLVSGFEFHKLAKWSFCHRYPLSLDMTKIDENDIVFLNLEDFNTFISIVHNTPPRNKFVLISHNSDITFSDEHARILEPFCNKIYAINTNCKHPDVITIPLGFVDNTYKPHIVFSELHANMPSKSILLYMNFNIETNRTKRLDCFNTFASKSWVTTQAAILPKLFYSQLSHSKYVLSPEGTGIDCHRIYESIYLGAIPVLKTSHMDNFYKTLPVLIVQSWEEVTYDWLEQNYEYNKANLDQWVSTHSNWYTAEFWLKHSLPNKS